MTSSIGMDPVDVALTNERNGYSSFDMDYVASPETIAKVNAVFDYIEANPEKWNQDTFGNHLTETNCFMGILCRINGKKTGLLAWHEDNGDVPDDFSDYSMYDGMSLIDMYDPYSDTYGHFDRGEYIAHFTEVPMIYADDDDTPLGERVPYRHPTLDEMRGRVSIALNHDFRKPKANDDPTDVFSQALHDSVQDELHGKPINDPTVDCCGRDAADCDCLPCGCVPHKTRMTDFGLYCDTEKQGYCNFECPHEDDVPSYSEGINGDDGQFM